MNRTTICKVEADYKKIIEAVVTNNMGFLDNPPEKPIFDDFRRGLMKLHSHLTELEYGKRIFENWEERKELPIIWKFEGYVYSLG